MLWIINKETSHAIISCNTFFDKEKNIHQLWITRPNGKNLCVKEGTSEEVNLFKEAIDYAVEKGEFALRIAS